MNFAKTKELDSSIALMRDAYLFIPKLRQKYNSDIIETRIMLKRAVCISGPDAGELFYDNEKMMREGAMPVHVQATLTGRGVVQTLDGELHRKRKELFMSFMTREKISQLLTLTENAWQAKIIEWKRKSENIKLFDEAQDILCEAACAWVGVPLAKHEARKRARDLEYMVDGFGSVGRRFLRGRFARTRCENWIEKLILKIRMGDLPASQSILAKFALYEDINGSLLAPRLAAAEVLNLIRPIVAISRYIVFLAHALDRHPEYKEDLNADADAGIEDFVQEVRRSYPFTPVLGARARKDFEWNGYRFLKKQMVVLDVYGILHDPRIWDQPDKFMPERFWHKKIGPFDLIAQGGGDHFTGHRCAGEWLTIAVMKQALQNLLGLDYQMSDQDMTMRLDKMPTMPKSGIIFRLDGFAGSGACRPAARQG